MPESAKDHWERVYQTKASSEVSWYQPIPFRSLELIEATGLGHGAAILDVGGGDSTLVDHLLAEGYTDLTVLDLAPSALERARARLGTAAERVHWIAGDVQGFVPERRYALWHDRAVFHFLVDAAARERYLGVLRKALAPDGWVMLASFGPEGPEQCSGLSVQRYSAEAIGRLLGEEFKLEQQRIEQHQTPGGGRQQFMYGLWRRAASSDSNWVHVATAGDTTLPVGSS